MTALFTLERLTKYLPEQPEQPLFSGITAQITAGERITLLGASGQGKSTLMRIMSLLETSDSGSIALDGKPSSAWQAKDWRKQVCYVAQQAVMLPGSVEANLRTVSNLHSIPFEKELAAQLMEAVGLSRIDWTRPAGDLSGGEKQRVALVRALLLHPRLLLLDEVTASLDPGSKQEVERLLLSWSEREHTAYLWVTHDLAQAAEVSDTVWFMAEGRLLETSGTADFFSEPSTDQARSFIHRESAQGGVADE
ncbi:putative ABC transport system ATP-binding protein [Paenibacillus phyllosphaerae]|uniref:Putative ABC transport system ATP-binding protein n=1 Tax=Paenibacillus phyllosphaerae TaxID=274593 RepID=A0A7W5ATR5_9BACL|nr:ATP-binding cassette domain-containing protein [Paenibacillus phyllosphaerae]MBB3108620.1 putative ABC transport system ATP-binding protein [Paenibacillus phyllosphaerae]